MKRIIAAAAFAAFSLLASDAEWKIRRAASEDSSIMRTLHFLTDVHGPRLTGSPRFKAAADWAAGQLREWGLANVAVPAAELDAATLRLATRIAGVPRSHLAMHKLVVNQALLAMGLEQSQMLATLFDGIARHNPEGRWFRREAQVSGYKAAVAWRDSGRPIPEGDEARALIAELERRLRADDDTR